MSRPQAIVFIDTVLALMLTRRAAYATDQGYLTYLIAPPFPEAQLEALRRFETDNREGRSIYTKIYHPENFDLQSLGDLLAEIEQEADLKGLIVGNGPFSKDGLIGAHVATLAEQRGLPSQNADALYLSNNKYLMRDALRATGMNTIDFGLAVDAESARAHAERIGYPLLMKPINGVASHLILKCNDERELLENFQLAMEKMPSSSFQDFYSGAHSYPNRAGELLHFDPMRSLLIEQYIPGREVSVEVLITEDRYIPLLIHDKIDLIEESRCVYENMAIVPPVRFSEEERRALEACAAQAAQAVGLKNSIAHIELRYGENGLGPQVIEINPRMGGGFISESLKQMVGIDYNQTYVELMTGTYQAKETYEVLQDHHGMFLLFAPHAGLLQAIEGIDELKELPGIIHVMQPVPPGTQIQGDDEEVMLLVVWMKCDSADHLIDTYNKAQEIVQFKIDRTENSDHTFAQN